MTKLSGPMVPPASGGAPRQAVVLLHGYGSDGADLISTAPLFQDLLPDAVFLSPNAPTPAGMVGFGFQWFAIGLENNRLASRQAGIATARPVLVEFLEDLWAQTGVRPADTLLAGFSQGAMMALHVGLSLPEKLMGILAFSGGLFEPEGFGTEPYAKPAVCLVHGDRDNVVDPSLSREAAERLRAVGMDVSLTICRGLGHGISEEGLAAARAFISDRLAAAAR